MERVGDGGYRLQVVLGVCEAERWWSDKARIGEGLLFGSGRVLGVGGSLDLVNQ